MKLITITHKDGSQENLTGEDVHILNDSLFYDKDNTERVRVDVKGATVEVKENPQPKREWQVVIGRNSGSVWYQREHTLRKDIEVEIVGNLTENEADVFTRELIEKRQEYKNKNNMEF